VNVPAAAAETAGVVVMRFLQDEGEEWTRC
jgi:hypothetical protein